MDSDAFREVARAQPLPVRPPPSPVAITNPAAGAPALTALANGAAPPLAPTAADKDPLSLATTDPAAGALALTALGHPDRTLCRHIPR